MPVGSHLRRLSPAWEERRALARPGQRVPVSAALAAGFHMLSSFSPEATLTDQGKALPNCLARPAARLA